LRKAKFKELCAKELWWELQEDLGCRCDSFPATKAKDVRAIKRKSRRKYENKYGRRGSRGGPSPLGGLILDGVGISQIKLLEYAAPHRHYLEKLFSKKLPWQFGRWRKIWDKYEPFTGGHLPNMSPEIGTIDLHAPAADQLNCFDSVTSLTVLEAITSNEADFHKVFLNALDTLKGGGLAAMTFVAGLQDWTDGKGHKYPAAGVSFERIKAAITLIDPEAWVYLVPRVAADGHSDYEGIMGAVFTKHSQYNRPLVEQQLQKLRAQESIENHRSKAASAASVRGKVLALKTFCHP
jgi:hypothetical protein